MKSLLAVVVFAALVTSGKCADSKTIQCYTCGGSFKWTDNDLHNNNKNSAYYTGCAYPFNATDQHLVACPGKCVTATIFDPTLGGDGSFDTIIRGCTVTDVPVGCRTGENPAKPFETVCVNVCSADKCNSADELSSPESKTINCHTCRGSFMWTDNDLHNNNKNSAFYTGCAYPFNATDQHAVACPGQCITATIYDPTVNVAGSFDTIVRGCSVTPVPVGCRTGAVGAQPFATVCVNACSADKCNSANGLRVAATSLLVVVGLAYLLALRR